MKSYITRNICVLCTFMGIMSFTSNADAQNKLPENSNPMIVTPHNQSVSYKERTLCYDITANIDYTVTSNQDWATVRKAKNGNIYVHLTQNYYGESRTATLTFANEDKNISQTLNITQGADQSIEDYDSGQIIPSSGTDNSHNTGSSLYGDITLSYDGKTNTCYHSNYNVAISASNPAILTYNFTDVERIDSIVYIPRPSDTGSNGNFGEVTISYKLEGETSYTVYGTYDWGMTSDVKTLRLENGLINPVSIRFTVNSGYGDWASCAEMQFYADNGNNSDFSIFADDLYSQLKEGVTQDDINKLSSSFVKALATQILEGTYRTDYRVATFPCLLSVESLAEKWVNPGSYYDQFPGVTGISFAPGKHAVIVRDLPAGKTAELKVVTYYCGLSDGNFKTPRPQWLTYTLNNGINVIDYDPESSHTFADGGYKSDYYALAYINYDDDDDPHAYSDMRVHFVNGIINGYLSPDKTNEEMHEMTGNPKNYCMDVLSSKTHTVWTCANLHKYCKSIDGEVGYRQFMNVLDSIVDWEHEVLGFKKYGLVPENRTFGYVNFRYFLYRDGLGVSFHNSVEYEHLDCDWLVNDVDAIWGISHEWGHLHQLSPYFCWKGITEISNNINSYYNIRRMCYSGDDFVLAFPKARKVFIGDNLSTMPKSSTLRSAAYQNASKVKWNTAYYNLALAMEDSTFTTRAADSTHAPGLMDYNSVNLIGSLAPFAKVFAYFTQNGLPDFAPDYYEALRETHQEGGSTIEKKDGYDKYELVAAAQNSNKNGAIAKLAEKYPESVWTQYITTSHCNTTDNTMPFIMNYIRKLSRISGYNLFPYFDRWGFMRQVAIYQGDYGYGWSIFTKDAYDEFKADMDALVADGTLKEMPDGMVEEISDCPDLTFEKPTFPN